MQVFKALASETRFHVLELILEHEPVCICELDELCSRDRSVISRHIKKLDAAGIIETEKDGRKLISTVPQRKTVETLIKAKEVLEDENTDPGERMPGMSEA
ncbi:MAG: metalloregulator ArsR/SmtB family transcription factor [Candidatus Nanohaloarchaea archaeon]|nr:metalloregulator ArsR/SmtB family transcription factor [Candidatus Nanohaloarchaea archaeon]